MEICSVNSRRNTISQTKFFNSYFLTSNCEISFILFLLLEFLFLLTNFISFERIFFSIWIIRSPDIFLKKISLTFFSKKKKKKKFKNSSFPFPKRKTSKLILPNFHFWTVNCSFLNDISNSIPYFLNPFLPRTSENQLWSGRKGLKQWINPVSPLPIYSIFSMHGNGEQRGPRPLDNS